jgi:hypothetical protein
MDRRDAADRIAGGAGQYRVSMSGHGAAIIIGAWVWYDAAHGGIVRHVAGNIAYGGRKERGWRRGHEVSQKKG